MLVEYLRNEYGQRYGAVVALYKGKVGWSLCWMEKDTWNKKQAIKKASKKAKSGIDWRESLPERIKMADNPAKRERLKRVLDTTCKMYDRADKYFKQGEKLVKLEKL